MAYQPIKNKFVYQITIGDHNDASVESKLIVLGVDVKNVVHKVLRNYNFEDGTYIVKIEHLGVIDLR